VNTNTNQSKAHHGVQRVKNNQRFSYKNLIDAFDIPTVILHPESSEIAESNRSFCEMVGCDSESIQHKNIFEIDLFKNSEINFSKFLTNVFESTDNRVKIEVKNDKLKFADYEISANQCEIDDDIYLVCKFHPVKTLDSDQIKKIDNENFRLAAIVENSDDAILSLDLNGKIETWNKSAERVYGYVSEEVIGKNIAEFIPPEIMERESVVFQKIKNGEVIQNYETFRKRKDGTSVRISLTISPIKNHHGEMIGISKIARDITSLDSAAEAHRRLVKELADIKFALDESSIVAITDQTGKINYVNDKFCEISGYSRGELLGQDHRIINSGFHPKEFIRQIWTTIANGKVWHGELKNRAKDGTFYWVDTTIVPFLDENGKPYQYVAIRNDITTRKRAENIVLELNETLERKVNERTLELNALNRELEAFSYSVSHDLRAPLRAIDGFSLALIEDCADALDVEGRNYLERVRAATQKMSRLIDDLLSLSRMSRGEFKLEKINVSQIVEEICAHLLENQAKRSIQLIIEKDVYAIADERMLRIALENLLENAWKFTSKKECAEIEFGFTSENSGQRYFIRDNGAGFDMAYKDKLFGAFQRLHSSQEFEGTGIGLATVQRIINRHNGSISAESVVGEGSIFYFTLGQEK